MCMLIYVCVSVDCLYNYVLVCKNFLPVEILIYVCSLLAAT